jgi:ADP-ribose pyrophosphatase
VARRPVQGPLPRRLGAGLRADTLTAPGRPDEEFDRYVVELPGAVMILAVDADEQVVVLRQYRHAVRSRLVELPAGILDVPGEDPVVAARRELREETSLVPTAGGTW